MQKSAHSRFLVSARMFGYSMVKRPGLRPGPRNALRKAFTLMTLTVMSMLIIKDIIIIDY